jgi:hypothetical protein
MFLVVFPLLMFLICFPSLSSLLSKKSGKDGERETETMMTTTTTRTRMMTAVVRTEKAGKKKIK